MMKVEHFRKGGEVLQSQHRGFAACVSAGGTAGNFSKIEIESVLSPVGGLRKVFAPVMDKDVLLVSDGNTSEPPSGAAFSVSREAHKSSAERDRNKRHIQNVNNRHSHLKDIIERRRGIATKIPCRLSALVPSLCPAEELNSKALLRQRHGCAEHQCDMGVIR